METRQNISGEDKPNNQDKPDKNREKKIKKIAKAIDRACLSTAEDIFKFVGVAGLGGTMALAGCAAETPVAAYEEPAEEQAGDVGSGNETPPPAGEVSPVLPDGDVAGESGDGGDASKEVSYAYTESDVANMPIIIHDSNHTDEEVQDMIGRVKSDARQLLRTGRAEYIVSMEVFPPGYKAGFVKFHMSEDEPGINTYIGA